MQVVSIVKTDWNRVADKRIILILSLTLKQRLVVPCLSTGLALREIRNRSFIVLFSTFPRHDSVWVTSRHWRCLGPVESKLSPTEASWLKIVKELIHVRVEPTCHVNWFNFQFLAWRTFAAFKLIRKCVLWKLSSHVIASTVEPVIVNNICEQLPVNLVLFWVQIRPLTFTFDFRCNETMLRRWDLSLLLFAL